jgi:hypothetical protein
VTEEKVKVRREMYDSRQHIVEKIADTVGVSRNAVYHYFKVDPAPTPTRRRSRRRGSAPRAGR